MEAHTASSEYTLRCDPMDGGSHSSSRFKVLNIFNVVFYQPEKLKVYFHFLLVLLITNSNKKVLSLLMDISPLNDYPNYL